MAFIASFTEVNLKVAKISKEEKMAELELINVYKDYKLENKNKFTALTDINVSFEKGELVSIVG